MALSKKKILATTLDLKPNTKFIDNKVIAAIAQSVIFYSLIISNFNIYLFYFV